MTACPLCGFMYEPGGDACRASGCPLAGTHCRLLHCPRCGYAVPDEAASAAARWIRRILGPAEEPAPTPRTLATLPSGASGVIDRIEGDPATRARLSAFGLVPGTEVQLLQTMPSVVVGVAETTLAMESAVAAEIWLRG